jgi:replicative superfamily II helicase
MSTLKSVGNKLFKTELATQRVELAIADDMAKLSSEADAQLARLKADNENLRTIDKNVADIKKLAETELAKAVKNIGFAEGTMKKITDILGKAEKTAKELGIDVKTIPAYSQLSKVYNSLEVYTEDKEFGEYKNLSIIKLNINVERN